MYYVFTIQNDSCSEYLSQFQKKLIYLEQIWPPDSMDKIVNLSKTHGEYLRTRLFGVMHVQHSMVIKGV